MQLNLFAIIWCSLLLATMGCSRVDDQEAGFSFGSVEEFAASKGKLEAASDNGQRTLEVSLKARVNSTFSRFDNLVASLGTAEGPHILCTFQPGYNVLNVLPGQEITIRGSYFHGGMKSCSIVRRSEPLLIEIDATKIEHEFSADGGPALFKDKNVLLTGEIEHISENSDVIILKAGPMRKIRVIGEVRESSTHVRPGMPIRVLGIIPDTGHDQAVITLFAHHVLR